MAEQTIWGVHMPLEQGLEPVQGARGYVVIGWHRLGDLSLIEATREAFKAAFARAYPGEKPGTIPVSAGVPYRFVCEMKEGDVIIVPSKADRMVNIGLLEGDYHYVAAAAHEQPNRRNVRWLKHLPRSSFSQAALNEIGSFLTLFKVSSNSDEFLAAMAGEAFDAEGVDEASAERVSAQVEVSTQDFILKRLKTSQTPYQFENFVAHLLKCMGYHSRVTQASGDGGIDIIAHRDELGFEPPIIKVQCKQIETTIDRPAVQQLHGAIESGEHGLFVTLGNYSAGARTFERTKPNLRLIDGTDLVELIYAHYRKFEPRYQMLIPLKQSYIPGSLLDGHDEA